MGEQKGSSFRDLQVWKLSIQLVADVYAVADQLPDSEKFGVRSQLCRAVVSIPSNIAEGQGRRSGGDFARFLRISLGSCRECQSLLEVCKVLGYIEDFADLDVQMEEISRMLNGLMRSVENRVAKH